MTTPKNKKKMDLIDSFVFREAKKSADNIKNKQINDHSTDHADDHSTDHSTDHTDDHSHINDHSTDHTDDHSTDHTDPKMITLPIIPPIILPIIPDTDHSTDHADDHSTDHDDDHSTDHTDDQSTDHADDHSTDHADDHSTDQTDDHSTDHADDHSTDQTDDHSTDHADDHSTDQTDDHSIILLIKNSSFFINNIEQLKFLTDNQLLVINFLSNHFPDPVSHKIISERTGVSWITVRRCVSSLVKEGLITEPKKYRKGTFQGFIYKLTKKLISPNDTQKSDHSDDRLPDMSPALIRKKERFFLNNLSFSDFWINQGLTQQKLNTWIEEFDFTEEEWVNQLMFGEHEPKVKNADNPVNYFYKSLKSGGLTRPEKFEFPEERRIRIQAENVKARQELLAKAEKLREQEKELADKEAFMELLQDKESIEKAIADFENELKIRPDLKVAVAQFRKKGSINSVLENRLKRWFNTDFA